MNQSAKACSTNLASLSDIGTIPSKVTEIGDKAFSGCTNLQSANVPYKSNVPDGLFSGCSNLTKIELSPFISRIGAEAFRGTSITSITLPENLSSIGACCFYGCKNLKEIHIPKHVKEISRINAYDSYSTYQPSKIDKIAIPRSVRHCK
ncbi:MAG: leucine-rich repeat domain-containing protein [Lachnospiraceae bacterium]|nr:leucine-rich repeat domain-containing protein [Lachnospiraceae bacterium]